MFSTDVYWFLKPKTTKIIEKLEMPINYIRSKEAIANQNYSKIAAMVKLIKQFCILDFFDPKI